MSDTAAKLTSDIVSEWRRVPKQEAADDVADLEKKISKRKNQFRELEDVLPHENG